jgi:predicted dehydrogenase
MSYSKILQVVLIGCGAVAELYYTPALKELERLDMVRVRALFDPNLDRVARLNKCFPAAGSLKDLNEIYKLDLDLAIIASPPVYHAEQTIFALKSGLAVLCEKPMATKVADGEAMIETAASAQKVLAIGLLRRFFPATWAIGQLLDMQVLGQVRSFYFSEGGIFRWPTRSRSFFDKTVAGGGVLIDIGVHLLDLLTWWFGRPEEILYEDDAMGAIEANCRMRLTLANGVRGKVRLSRDVSLPNRYVIEGEKGWLAWNVNEADRIQMGFNDIEFAHDIRLCDKRFSKKLPDLGRPSFNFEQSFVDQLRNVVAAIHGAEKLLVPPEQALAGLRLIENCYRHRKLLPMAWLNESELMRAHELNTKSSLC